MTFKLILGKQVVRMEWMDGTNSYHLKWQALVGV
jgi:hypothetical protein